MKISVDGIELFELTETQKKIIKDDIADELFDNKIKQLLHYIINNKYQRCLDRLKNEWEPKLRQRVSSIPTDPDAFAELIFSQSDYKNRSQRDKEEKNNREKQNNNPKP